MTKIMITGSRGFVGSHLVELVRARTDWEIVPEVRGGVSPDYVVHLGAMTDIEGSLRHPEQFVEANVVGTSKLLKSLDLAKVKQFIYFSTDEVFGPLVTGRFQEWDRHNPQTPYAATKSGAEALCLAYASSYGLPVMITYCMNLIGEGQPARKFLPTVVRRAMTGETLHLYTDKEGNVRLRDYLHAKDAADAVLFLLKNGTVARDKFNIARIAAYSPITLIESVEQILKKKITVEFVQAGSQFSGLDGWKLHDLGWEPPVGFMERLETTVNWLVATGGWRLYA
jgi:dTDP-glucose 4,6-dehydratase